MAALTNPEPPALVVSRRHWLAMRDHIHAHSPEEACGLVAGTQLPDQPGWRSQAVLPVDNQLHSPVRYQLEPHEQLAALEKIDNQGWELAAIFHSHPGGPDHPSATDIAESYYPETIYLIWYPGKEGWCCKAFLIRDQDYQETELMILDA